MRNQLITLTALMAGACLMPIACRGDCGPPARELLASGASDGTGWSVDHTGAEAVFTERSEERRNLVESWSSSRYRESIDDPRVLYAMLTVPRHAFVPSRYQGQAYDDRPLPIGHGVTISQPFIVAMMTDVLELDDTSRVLEIGTGSGYQAAVLAEITPHVYTIEIIEALAETAASRLAELGYATVQTRVGDGYFGWPEAAPFDGIIVTAAAGHVPPPLVEQLAPGGRMIIPIGAAYDVQRLVLVTKSADSEVGYRDLIPVRFVPLTGAGELGQ